MESEGLDALPIEEQREWTRVLQRLSLAITKLKAALACCKGPGFEIVAPYGEFTLARTT